ncbi:hypothetical protein [Pseudomonas sp. GM67]|uniref:hypothetical protein n=1 Tax=Pseudomonas sp. GM67 TaxID=1144335 RepID=UPI000270D2B9|nr:hypothetical protein [Pseudomonas sp. GM67]EJM94754.1 hypothetical protein PMI33_00175 [Pseudomonas sp. GM67]
MDSLRRCNLCLKRKEMTRDHIFPQSIAMPMQRQISLILKQVKPEERGKRTTFLAQNGLQKRTLCGNCNNKVLGTILDPALEHLCKETSIRLRNSRFLMNSFMHLENIQLNKVARAVAGHFLAHDDAPTHKHLLVKALRRYVLNADQNFPENFRFHIWLYPFKEQAVMKDLFHSQLGSGYEPFAISAYKTFPLAFAFSNKIHNPAYAITGTLDITEHLSSNLDEHYRIKIDARTVVDRNWPYAPLKDGAILTSENGSIITKPHVNKKPYPY